MRKKVIAVLLICVLVFSLSVTSFAAGETHSVLYYSIEMRQSWFDNTVTTETVDVMIYPTQEEIYINAEDLGILSGYSFQLSENDCAYSSEERGHLVYYKFNSKKMLVYQSGQPLSYKMPYPARYVDGVAWIPLDFGMKMLNMNYAITENGAACCQPYETVFSVAHRILAGEFEFNYAEDLGYSDLAMFGMETGAFLTNLFSGLLAMEGSCWGTLVTSVFGGNKDLYDGMMAEEICDLFVMPAENEVATVAKGIYQLPLNYIKTESASTDLYFDYMAVKTSKLAKNAGKISEEVKNVTGSVKLSDITKNFSVGWEDAIGCLIDIAAMRLQFENREEVAVRALTQYGKDSDSNVAGTVRSYAKDVSIDSEMQGALTRYFKENWDNILLGSINLGSAALVNIGWNIVTCSFPYLSDSLDSTKSFAYAQQATAMQNDAYWILEEDHSKALSSKKLKESSLEDVATGCYTYLKFSLIARECAIASVNSATEIDDSTKKTVAARLQSRNDTIAEMLSVVSNVEEGSSLGVDNSNGAYGALLPSENTEYRRNLDDTPVIEAIRNGLGTLIASSTQEAQPVEDVVITEEEAIEMVRSALNKYSMGLMESKLKDLYTFECLDLCDAYIIDLESEDILEETAEFETDYCYIIGLYVDGVPNALFCVSADGTGAYIGSVYDDVDYAFMEDFNLNDLSFGDLFKVMKQLYELLFRAMLEEQNPTPDTSTEDSIPLTDLIPESPVTSDAPPVGGR